jgi:hypothetical protein
MTDKKEPLKVGELPPIELPAARVTKAMVIPQELAGVIDDLAEINGLSWSKTAVFLLEQGLERMREGAPGKTDSK